jgi:hypothetical protein
MILALRILHFEDLSVGMTELASRTRMREAAEGLQVIEIAPSVSVCCSQQDAQDST